MNTMIFESSKPLSPGSNLRLGLKIAEATSEGFVFVRMSPVSCEMTYCKLIARPDFLSFCEKCASALKTGAEHVTKFSSEIYLTVDKRLGYFACLDATFKLTEKEAARLIETCARYAYDCEARDDFPMTEDERRRQLIAAHHAPEDDHEPCPF